ALLGISRASSPAPAPRSPAPAALSLALLSTGLALPAAAQIAPQPSVSADAIKQREQELEAARIEQRSTAELQQKLKADIAAIGQDRSTLNQQLIDTATQERPVETRNGEAEARLATLHS